MDFSKLNDNFNKLLSGKTNNKVCKNQLKDFGEKFAAVDAVYKKLVDAENLVEKTLSNSLGDLKNCKEYIPEVFQKSIVEKEWQTIKGIWEKIKIEIKNSYETLENTHHNAITWKVGEKTPSLKENIQLFCTEVDTLYKILNKKENGFLKVQNYIDRKEVGTTGALNESAAKKVEELLNKSIQKNIAAKYIGIFEGKTFDSLVSGGKDNPYCFITMKPSACGLGKELKVPCKVFNENDKAMSVVAPIKGGLEVGHLMYHATGCNGAELARYTNYLAVTSQCNTSVISEQVEKKVKAFCSAKDAIDNIKEEVGKEREAIAIKVKKKMDDAGQEVTEEVINKAIKDTIAGKIKSIVGERYVEVKVIGKEADVSPIPKEEWSKGEGKELSGLTVKKDKYLHVKYKMIEVGEEEKIICMKIGGLGLKDYGKADFLGEHTLPQFTQVCSIVKEGENLCGEAPIEERALEEVMLAPPLEQIIEEAYIEL